MVLLQLLVFSVFFVNVEVLWPLSLLVYFVIDQKLFPSSTSNSDKVTDADKVGQTKGNGCV